MNMKPSLVPIDRRVALLYFTEKNTEGRAWLLPLVKGEFTKLSPLSTCLKRIWKNFPLGTTTVRSLTLVISRQICDMVI